MDETTMLARLAQILASDRRDEANAAYYLPLARSLAAAMRDPTERMCDRLPHGYRPGSHSVREIWNGLIDGALAEGRAPKFRREAAIEPPRERTAAA